MSNVEAAMVLMISATLRATKRTFALFAMAGLVFVSSGLLASEAMAEPIPPEYLQADYDSCIAEDNSKWMKQYCRCFVTEIERTMPFKEYLEVAEEISQRLAAGASDSDVLTTNKTFMDAVEFCVEKTG